MASTSSLSSSVSSSYLKPLLKPPLPDSSIAPVLDSLESSTPSSTIPLTSYPSSSKPPPSPPSSGSPLLSSSSSASSVSLQTLQSHRDAALDAAHHAELLLAFDLGTAAALESMQRHWAAEAADLCRSVAEKRIFRREAQRLANLLEETLERGRQAPPVTSPRRGVAGSGSGDGGGDCGPSDRERREKEVEMWYAEAERLEDLLRREIARVEGNGDVGGRDG